MIAYAQQPPSYQVGKVISLAEARAKNEDKSVSTLLRDVYLLCEQKKPRIALKCIFEMVDLWMRRSQWAVIDKLLATISLDKLAPTCALGFLTITAPAKEKLANRAAYYHRAKEALRSELEAPTTLALFQNLE